MNTYFSFFLNQSKKKVQIFTKNAFWQKPYPSLISDIFQNVKRFLGYDMLRTLLVPMVYIFQYGRNCHYCENEVVLLYRVYTRHMSDLEN
jgi:hypothetical protein